MLRMSVAQEEYLMIGDDVKIVFLGGTGRHMRIMIDAPREVNIVRSTVLEKQFTDPEIRAKLPKYYAEPEHPEKYKKKPKVVIARGNVGTAPEGIAAGRNGSTVPKGIVAGGNGSAAPEGIAAGGNGSAAPKGIAAGGNVGGAPKGIVAGGNGSAAPKGNAR